MMIKSFCSRLSGRLIPPPLQIFSSTKHSTIRASSSSIVRRVPTRSSKTPTRYPRRPLQPKPRRKVTTPISITIPANMEPIITDLHRISKYKVRSHDTSKNSHIPLLHSQIRDAPENGPIVVLVGDSMLERMITTGQWANFVEPWPSHAMLSDETLGRVNLGRETKPEVTRLNCVFNAGVGGDKIQNVAYRLAGTSATNVSEVEGQEEALPGLLPMLAACETVKLWIVHMGANNLHPKRGLSSVDLAALRTLLSALGRVNEGKNRILVTGLTPRKDISPELVDAANVGIANVVKELDAELGPTRVLFGRPPAVDTGKHLDDHVHLNLEGYRLWVEQLVVEVVDSLQLDVE